MNRPSVVETLTRVITGAAAAMIVAATAGIPSALAHSQLVKTDPPRRAVISKSPAQVRLWFNEEIEGDYTSLVVLDAAKQPVTEAAPQAAQDDPKSIVLPLPELAPGKYIVKFRVLSIDGHVIDSSFDFTVKGTVHRK